jgi:hypothetical protein
MKQKFFISFNSADQTKAHWIAWTLKEAGHEAAVHDWEVPAGGNAPLWIDTKLAWADRLIAVISPEYVPTRYSPMEWASQIWSDPDGTKGSVIPVIVRQTPNIPPLLRSLSWIDLTNCSEDEAQRRLIQGVDMPAPPQRKPAFEKVKGEAPDSQDTGPAEKPTFVAITPIEIIFANTPPFNERTPRFEPATHAVVAEDLYVCVGLRNNAYSSIEGVSVTLLGGLGPMVPRPLLPRQMRPRNQPTAIFHMSPQSVTIVELVRKRVIYDGSGNEWWKAGLEFRFADDGHDAKILSGGYTFKFGVSSQTSLPLYFWLAVSDWEDGRGRWEAERLPENYSITRMDGTIEIVHLLGL